MTLSKKQQRLFQQVLETTENFLNTEPTTDAGRLASIEHVIETSSGRAWPHFSVKIKLRLIRKARVLLELLLTSTGEQHQKLRTQLDAIAQKFP